MTQRIDEPFEHYVARQLNFMQWEFLADHFNDGRRPVVYGPDRVINDAKTRMVLLVRKLLVVDPPPHRSPRPTHTVLTDLGHGVMCAALGMMADLLTQNGIELRQPLEHTMEKKYGHGYGFRNSVVVRYPRDVQHVDGSRDGHR